MSLKADDFPGSEFSMFSATLDSSRALGSIAIANLMQTLYPEKLHRRD